MLTIVAENPVQVDPWFPYLFLAPAYNSLVASRVVRRSCQLFEQSGELNYGERLSVVVREAQLQKSVAEGLLQQLQPSGDAVERIRVARDKGEAPWPGQGPPARTREMYGSEIIGIAQGESGDWAYARWTSGCAYEVSSMAAVSGAVILAARKGRAPRYCTMAFRLHKRFKSFVKVIDTGYPTLQGTSEIRSGDSSVCFPQHQLD